MQKFNFLFKPIYVLFLILLVLALTFYFNNKPSTLNTKSTKFSRIDFQEVQWVKFHNNVDTISISKNGQSWELNNQYIANPLACEKLLKLIEGIEIKAPVRNSGKNAVNSNLNNKILIAVGLSGIEKVEFWISEDTIKHITYAGMLENDDVFSIRAIGFPPRLTPFFNTQLTFWKSKHVFHLNFNEIRSIKTILFFEPVDSFLLMNYGENKWGIKNLINNQLLDRIDPDKIAIVLNEMKNLKFQQKFYSEKVNIGKQTLQIVIEPIEGNQVVLDAFEVIGDQNVALVKINSNPPSVFPNTEIDRISPGMNFYFEK